MSFIKIYLLIICIVFHNYTGNQTFNNFMPSQKNLFFSVEFDILNTVEDDDGDYRTG